MQPIRTLIAFLALVLPSIWGCGQTEIAPPPKVPSAEATLSPTNCLAGDYTPIPAGAKLAIQPRGTTCRSWYAAAALASIAQFYGTEINEGELMSAKTGDRCRNDHCDYSACSSSMDADDIAFSFQNVLRMQAKHVPDGISERGLQVELSSGRPVLLGFDGPFDGNYAIVTGFTPGNPATYTLASSWPEVGSAPRVYGDLLTDPKTGAHWSQTWTNILPPEAYCRSRAKSAPLGR